MGKTCAAFLSKGRTAREALPTAGRWDWSVHRNAASSGAQWGKAAEGGDKST